MKNIMLVILLSFFILCGCSVLQTTDYMLDKAYALSEVEVNNVVMKPTVINSLAIPILPLRLK